MLNDLLGIKITLCTLFWAVRYCNVFIISELLNICLLVIIVSFTLSHPKVGGNFTFSGCNFWDFSHFRSFGV